MEKQFLMVFSLPFILNRYLVEVFFITLKFNLKSFGNDSMSLPFTTWVITDCDLMLICESLLLFNYWEEMGFSQHTWKEEIGVCLSQ